VNVTRHRTRYTADDAVVDVIIALLTLTGLVAVTLGVLGII